MREKEVFGQTLLHIIHVVEMLWRERGGGSRNYFEVCHIFSRCCHFVLLALCRLADTSKGCHHHNFPNLKPGWTFLYKVEKRRRKPQRRRTHPQLGVGGCKICLHHLLILHALTHTKATLKKDSRFCLVQYDLCLANTVVRSKKSVLPN